MTDEKDILAAAVEKEYSEGFVTDIEQEFVPKGLNEEIIRLISAKKQEPAWLLDFRLEAFRKWKAAESLPTLRDHPSYDQVLRIIDRVCCKKSLQASTKISHLKTSTETPRYIWKRGAQELVLMQIMTNISCIQSV